MYYITSLAKFGNHCSMGWAHRQDQQPYSLSFQRRWKKVMRCFTKYFQMQFSILAILQYFLGIKNYPSASHVLLLWWSGAVAIVLRTLKSVVWKYISPIYFVILQYNTQAYLLCTDNWYGILHLQSGINSEAICGQGGLNLGSHLFESLST